MGVENTRQSALDELSHLETMPLLHFLAHFGRTFQNATLNFLVPILPHHVLYLLDTSAQMACPGRKFPDCGLQTSTTKAPSPHKTLPGLRESGARKEGRWGDPQGLFTEKVEVARVLLFTEKAEVARVLLLPEMSRNLRLASRGSRGRWGRS